MQHELVNRKSLPLVKKQPFKIDLQTLNVLYEMTVAELEMIALSSYNMKIGFLKTNSGRVYFHEECTVVCEDSYAVEDINLRQAL